MSCMLAVHTCEPLMLVLPTNHMFHFKPAMRHELTWLLHAMPATSMLFRKSFLSESQSWTSAVEQILIQQGSRKLARRMLSLAALMEMEFGIQEPFVLLILVWCMLILLFNKLGVYSGEQHPIVDVKYHGKRQVAKGRAFVVTHGWHSRNKRMIWIKNIYFEDDTLCLFNGNAAWSL